MNAKSVGIFGLLVALFLFMTFMTAEPWYDLSSSTFLLHNSIENLLRRISMYGLLGIGVAFGIITGGIDLSVGSIVCLAGCLVHHAQMAATFRLPVFTWHLDFSDVCRFGPIDCYTHSELPVC